MSEPSPVDRYSRQRIIDGFGDAGQEALRRGHAVIVGVGALGCVTADILCRAGVGKLTIIDRDVVDVSNLHRQGLYSEDDARRGLPKVEAAFHRLQAVNSEVQVVPIAADIGPSIEPLEDVLRASGAVLIDGTDNFETRYLLNDLSVLHGVPLVYAGVLGARATQATFTPGSGPCLRCIEEQAPATGTIATCESAGVFPPAVVIAGGAQASDAIKLLAGLQVTPSLLSFDLLRGVRSRFDLSHARQEGCPCCAHRRFAYLESAREHRAWVSMCGQRAVQVVAAAGLQLDLAEVARRARGTAKVDQSALSLRIRGDEADWEMSVFSDGRAIIRGAVDAGRARSIYARYVGV